MTDIAEVKIEKGTETVPTLLRIRFNPMPWNFAFHQGRMERWIGSEAECQELEVREAIRKCVYLIERELRVAVRNQLGIDVR